MYSENDWRYYQEDYLAHHGILGQKWGIRRYQNTDGTLTPAGRKRYSDWYGGNENFAKHRLKYAEKSNLEKWGKSEDTNTLYITGRSGSGKSTVAGYLGDENDAEVINLDSYLSPMSKKDKVQLQSQDFNRYLDEEVPDWNRAVTKGDKLNYDIVDRFAKASEGYSKKLYSQGTKLIIEGVQISDNTLYEDRDSAYKGKPMITITTSKEESDRLATERDKDR